MDSGSPSSTDLVQSFERLGLLGAALAGTLGLLVAVFCFFVPGLHFILGPFGPFFGGLVGTRLTGGGLSRGLIAVAIVTLGMTSIAAAFTGVIFGEEVESGLATAAPFIVFGYTALFSSIGAFVGSLIGGGKPTSSDESGAEPSQARLR